MRSGFGAGRRAMITTALALLFASCTPTVWEKPGAGQADFNQDSYECERDVRQSRTGTGLLGTLDARGFYNRCMSAHGYHPNGGTAPGLRPAALMSY